MRTRLVSLKICLSCLIVCILFLTGCQVELPATQPFLQSESPSLQIDQPDTAPVAVDTEAIGHEPVEPVLDPQLRALIAAQQLTGDPTAGRNLPSIESPLAQLGKQLFFSKALGGDLDVACVSCHHPLLGGGDGLSLSIGIGAHNPDLLGPGRSHPDGVPNVPRNAPTTFNIGMWDSALFWDGRVESLGKTAGKNGQDNLGIRTPDTTFGLADPNAGDNLAMAQARFPVTSKDEMRGYQLELANTNDMMRKLLADRLNGSADAGDKLDEAIEWVRRFESVFGKQVVSEREVITEHRIALALAEYERSQVFVNTPWKAYVEGDDGAISAEAKRGALLFFGDVETGGAGCANCHSGDFFTDEQFHVLAIPQVGPGKESIIPGADYGRFRETRHLDDLFAFRTPSLLNVEVTGPYGHSGAYESLEGIVQHHLDPINACINYDYSQLDPMIPVEYAQVNTEEIMDKLMENRVRGTAPTSENIYLTDSQIDELVAFLFTLTDPCVKDPVCLSPWIPTEAENQFDQQRLVATIPSIGE